MNSNPVQNINLQTLLSDASVITNSLHEHPEFQKLIRIEEIFNEETQRYNQMLHCKWPNCQKTFAKKCNMVDHLRMHIKMRPYNCP